MSFNPIGRLPSRNPALHFGMNRRTFLGSLGAAVTVAAVPAALLPSQAEAWPSPSPGSPGGKYCRLSAQDMLMEPPFPPEDVNLFNQSVYPEATPAAPAAPYEVDELQLRRDVFQTLSRRFLFDRSSVKEGMAVMNDPAIAAKNDPAIASEVNDPAIAAKVADPRLRASIAMMLGLPGGEAAIEAIKNGPYVNVRFGTPLGGDSVIAQVLPNADGQPEILINERYQYEDPRLLSISMLHETMHQDPQVTVREELICNGIDSIAYAQLLKEDPRLARSGTELSRRFNTKLMALINSRDEAGNIRLLSSQGPVYPGGADLAYFGESFVNAGLGAETPGNAVLESALFKITGLSLQGANFDDDTLALLDENINMAHPEPGLFVPTPPEDWIKVARALRLELPKPLSFESSC